MVWVSMGKGGLYGGCFLVGGWGLVKLWAVCAMVVLGGLCNGGFGWFVQWWFWVVCAMVVLGGL